MLKTVSEICVAADVSTTREDVEELLNYLRQHGRSYSLVDLGYMLEHLTQRKIDIDNEWWRGFAQENSELLALLGVRFKG